MRKLSKQNVEDTWVHQLFAEWLVFLRCLEFPWLECAFCRRKCKQLITNYNWIFVRSVKFYNYFWKYWKTSFEKTAFFLRGRVHWIWVWSTKVDMVCFTPVEIWSLADVSNISPLSEQTEGLWENHCLNSQTVGNKFMRIEKLSFAIARIAITLSRSPMATRFCFGQAENYLFSPEWWARNLTPIFTLKKCLVCFWLKVSSDFAVMSEVNDM